MATQPLLPDKIAQLAVSIGSATAGQLIKRSAYEFRYLDPQPEQAAVALLMPASERATWQDGDLSRATPACSPRSWCRTGPRFPSRHSS